MMRRIGLLGGTSWAATLVYYRRLNELVGARLGRNHSADLVVWSYDFQSLIDLLDRPHEIEQRMEESADALARAGCEVIAVASNTGHRYSSGLAAQDRFSFVHIGDATASRLARDGVRRPAVLATLQTLGDAQLLRRLAGGARPIRLPSELEPRLDRAIFDEFAHERVSTASAGMLDEVETAIAEAGADATLLACTELSFVQTQRPFPEPVYDTVEIHCEAIVREAFGA